MDFRPGFTLLEILVASGIGLIVMAVVIQAYANANKARALAVGGSLLKSAGQGAMDELYKGLHQSRHLFVRGDVADGFMARLALKPFDPAPNAQGPGPLAEDLRLPDLKANGSFKVTSTDGSPDPNFDPDSVGNALFFARSEPNATLNDIMGGALQQAFGNHQQLLPVYTLHLYYLARKPLPGGIVVRGTDAYVYDLMHFQSLPLLDYHELVELERALKRSSGSDAAVDAALGVLANDYSGAIALDATDPAQALFDLQATTDHLDLVDDGHATIQGGKPRSALNYGMQEAFGLAMVAFNTVSGPGHVGVPVPGLTVPLFAPTPPASPQGLEVLVAGPPDARQVLVRLALAARIQAGKLYVGDAFQTVIQVYDF